MKMKDFIKGDKLKKGDPPKKKKDDAKKVPPWLKKK